MAVFPCSICKTRRPGKLASAYWAWFNVDGSRSAWKLRYCLECAPGALQTLLAATSQQVETSNVFACVACGASAEEDSDPVYCTLYLPQREPMEYALQLDSACAAKLRIPITNNGERLIDRGAGVRGPSPNTLTRGWDVLGLEPSQTA